MIRPAKYVTISEAVFRDMLGAKSKLEDIKMLLGEVSSRTTKRDLMERLTVIVYSARYGEECENGG